ncbi:MAG: hypothetical protein KC503_45425 [Myxococcales bacterium]|nr:hypothetical protein [Myxococcales bacterium]
MRLVVIARLDSQVWHSKAVRFDWPSSREAQTASCIPRGLQIVCEARLDRRADLARTLGSSTSLTDAELLLESYARWGPDCVGHIDGEFALAVCDNRQRRIFAARDRFGVRPCYYAICGNRVIVSSNAALIAGLCGTVVSDSAIAKYLVAHTGQVEETFFVGVRRLPPASILIVDHLGCVVRRYWQLDARTSRRSASGLGDELRSLLIESVCARIPPKGPYGSMLSGGLDSSAITGIAAKHAANRAVHAFTFVHSRAQQADERRYARAFVDSHRQICWSIVDGSDLLAVCSPAPASQPSHAPNLAVTLAMYEAARARGLAVLLDGFDGDSVISHGTRRLLELLAGGKLSEFWREITAVARARELSQWAALKLLVLRPLAPIAFRRLVARARSAQHDENAALLAPRLRALAPAPPVQPIARSEAARHMQLLSAPSIGRTLELLDEAAGAHGIEPRYPFFERRLVELCVTIPAALKLHGGQTRWLMRRALWEELSSPIAQRRGKANLSHVFLALFSGHHAEFDRWLERIPDSMAPYVDRMGFRSTYERAKRGNLRGTLALFRMLALCRWLETVARVKEPPFSSPINLKSRTN